MSKAEREKLIEEKNQVLGQKKPVNQLSSKRNLFFNGSSNEDDKDMKDVHESSLTETERSLLKVTTYVLSFIPL